jgi:hypothetical protein
LAAESRAFLLSKIMSKQTYFEKLKDPRWQRKRLEIMERDDFTCVSCGNKEKTLNVHHKTYRKGAEPWDYEDGNFMTLCEPCHEQSHEFIDEIKQNIRSNYHAFWIMKMSELPDNQMSRIDSLFSLFIHGIIGKTMAQTEWRIKAASLFVEYLQIQIEQAKNHTYEYDIFGDKIEVIKESEAKDA